MGRGHAASAAPFPFQPILGPAPRHTRTDPLGPPAPCYGNVTSPGGRVTPFTWRRGRWWIRLLIWRSPCCCSSLRSMCSPRSFGRSCPARGNPPLRRSLHHPSPRPSRQCVSLTDQARGPNSPHPRQRVSIRRVAVRRLGRGAVDRDAGISYSRSGARCHSAGHRWRHIRTRRGSAREHRRRTLPRGAGSGSPSTG